MMTLLVYITAQQSGLFLGDLLSTVHPQSGVFPVVLHHCPVNLFGLLALHGVQAAVQNSSCGGEARSRAGDMAGPCSAPGGAAHAHAPCSAPAINPGGVKKPDSSQAGAVPVRAPQFPLCAPAMGLGRSAAGFCGEGGG